MSIFRLCGLCSQLVDESIQLDDSSQGLRSFVLRLLDLENRTLPTKVCTECYQGALECKKFKDRCDRAIRKLEKTNISSTMILGSSPADKQQASSLLKSPVKKKEPESLVDTEPVQESDLMPTKTKPQKGAKLGPKSRRGAVAAKPECPRTRQVKGLDPDLIIEGGRRSRGGGGPVQPEQPKRSPGPSEARSTRHRAVSVEAKSFSSPATRRRNSDAVGVTRSQRRSLERNKPSLRIDRAERALADQAYYSGEHSINFRKRRQLVTPSSSSRPGPASKRPKRSSLPSGFTAEDPIEVEQPARAPRGSRRSALKDDEPLKSSAKSTPSSTATTTSSYGRVRRPKKSHPIDPLEDNEEDDEEEDPLATHVTAKKSRAPPPQPSTNELRNARKNKTAKGGKNSSGQTVKSKEVTPKAAAAANEEDEEEIFPSIGPYQCEICQEITNTKKEFVEHIKRNHRSVVDEEVLRSLEKDLRISKKKEQKAKKEAAARAEKKKSVSRPKPNKVVARRPMPGSRARAKMRPKPFKRAPPKPAAKAARQQQHKLYEDNAQEAGNEVDPIEVPSQTQSSFENPKKTMAKKYEMEGTEENNSQQQEEPPQGISTEEMISAIYQQAPEVNPLDTSMSNGAADEPYENGNGTAVDQETGQTFATMSSPSAADSAAAGMSAHVNETVTSDQQEGHPEDHAQHNLPQERAVDISSEQYQDVFETPAPVAYY